ncbi:MAG: hypothetical protein IJI73_10515 [Kiritimatiellae bacterium]|nr:hypothetical protein [Kiritimatiellia bacterium]
MAETTQKETQIKVRHWYGAARGMAIAFPLAFLLLALAVLVFAYLPLGVVVVSALIGWAIPGRPHHEKGAWKASAAICDSPLCRVGASGNGWRRTVG